MIRACLIGAFAAAAGLGGAVAEDHGVYGEMFEISERDILEWIGERLAAAEGDGSFDAMNEEALERAERRVHRPPPVAGISTAERSESWLYDPTIVVTEDIVDHEGVPFAFAGQEVNPLDTIRMTLSYVFVQGDDADQVAWAVDTYRERNGLVSVILVDGAPLDLMDQHQMRFFFDQEGVLVRRFGITAVPALIEQEDRLIRVTEHGPDVWQGRAGGAR